MWTVRGESSVCWKGLQNMQRRKGRHFGCHMRPPSSTPWKKGIRPKPIGEVSLIKNTSVCSGTPRIIIEDQFTYVPYNYNGSSTHSTFHIVKMGDNKKHLSNVHNDRTNQHLLYSNDLPKPLRQKDTSGEARQHLHTQHVHIFFSSWAMLRHAGPPHLPPWFGMTQPTKAVCRMNGFGRHRCARLPVGIGQPLTH